MRINFEKITDIDKVLKYNIGIKPIYGKKGSTSRGIAWCRCQRCVGDLLLLGNNTVVGWILTECACGNHIDWSTARENL